MRRVLVTDGGSSTARSTLAAVRALAAGGFEPWVTTAGAPTLAAVSRRCAGTVRTARSDKAAYPADIEKAVARHDFAAVLCASDASLVALKASGHRLVAKDEVSRRAAEAGLPLLIERVLHTAEDVMSSAGEVAFPVVAKPLVRRLGHGPVHRVDTREELVRLAGSAPLLLQQWVEEPLSAYSGVMHDGRLVAVLAQKGERLWPPQAGTSSYARTVPTDPGLTEALEVLMRGHDGVFQAQFLGPFLIDLNPRVYGSLPLAVAAGLNLPAIHVNARLGLQQHVPAARLGVRYRWIEGDVRHVVSGLRSGRMDARGAARALVPHRGTAHSTESLTDPRPMLLRLRTAPGRDARRLA